jgi:hypothetical protein
MEAFPIEIRNGSLKAKRILRKLKHSLPAATYVENREEGQGDGAKRTKRERYPGRKGSSVWSALVLHIYRAPSLPYIRRKERGRKGTNRGGKEEKREKREKNEGRSRKWKCEWLWLSKK